MILIYGPAGSGKSTQGKILAERLGSIALSAGQIIRDSHKFGADTAIGAMIPEKQLVEMIKNTILPLLAQGKSVIFDGQPGNPEQVELWQQAGLLDKIEQILVIDLPAAKSLQHLAMRGRSDDNQRVWERKLDYYDQKITPFLDAFKQKGIQVQHIDGDGSIDEVSERIFTNCQ